MAGSYAVPQAGFSWRHLYLHRKVNDENRTVSSSLRDTMKLHIPKILSDKRGIATLELALLLPFLILMVLGIFDYSRAIHAKNIITNMSREGANLAARSGNVATNAQEYMNAIAYTAAPLNMQANGEIYITVVKGEGSTGSVISTVHQVHMGGGGISPLAKSGLWPCHRARATKPNKRPRIRGNRVRC